MRLKSNIVMIIILGCLLFPTLILSIIKDKNVEPVVSCDLISNNSYYIAIGESININGNPSDENQNVVSIDNGVVTGLKKGEVVLTSDCQISTITVTDLIETPQIKDKGLLKANTYSKQENDELDLLLENMILNVGYATRAGAVEAARFLTLRFPYKISYFYENGRLIHSDDFSYGDGEGRYYHKGLYLCEDRYSLLDSDAIINGPAYWGEDLQSDYDDEFTTNGLDCSGFITWALYNAGYNPGDLGSGPNDEAYDLSDLGKKKYIDTISINELKVGDLVGFDKDIGHVGMIIGIDDNNVYVAEEYWTNSLSVITYSYHEFINNSKWEYVMLMDSFYLYDGNLTNMW